MLINKTPSRTIWLKADHPNIVCTYDQRFFPHETRVLELSSLEDAAHAIREMVVRGAPLIGVTAAWGMYLAALKSTDQSIQSDIKKAAEMLGVTRPTAVNLHWAIAQQLDIVSGLSTQKEIAQALRENAEKMANEDVMCCFNIGQFTLPIIEKIAASKPGETVNILTHCNAGWLACIDWGTATSGIYQAHEKGIKIHVWVDETRPRNQGANLTAYELNEQGVPHTLITDNTGGHLMQHGMVDMVIVGTDRTTRSGDVANKIGTYLKALAAADNNIPFYVALPSTTIDWSISDGLKEIPIETRSPDEVRIIRGKGKNGIADVLLCPEETNAINYGFDVTPARLVTELITEKGRCEASEKGLLSLFPERG